jgi:hypothetical protein
MLYLLDNPAGLRVQSGQVLRLHGAKSMLSPAIESDGQAFLGNAVSAIEFYGGEIVRWRRSVSSPLTQCERS